MANRNPNDPPSGLRALAEFLAVLFVFILVGTVFPASL